MSFVFDAMVVLVLLILCSCQLVYSSSNSTMSPKEVYKDLHLSRNDTIYTDWSKWTRCVDCHQRRSKKCLVASCQDSRIYEIRPCHKKRCKRKERKRNKHFNVVHLNQDSSYLMRQAPSKIWSKWSSWSPCSPTCRTHRIRLCRKPGRCRKKQQEETAFCYHEGTSCMTYVLHLMEQESRYGYNRYSYGNNQESQNRRIGHSSQSGKKKPAKCGQPFRKMRMLKIIGGDEAKKYKWPWHVAILNKYFEVFCGGTLIGPRWVLTASHCVRQYLRVRLNEHDLRAYDGRELEMTVHKIFQHPKFNHETVDNDIALLQLPRAVNTPVACLPSRSAAPAELCSVMGWGKIRTSDTYGTHKLHEAKLPIVSPETCKRSYRHFLITSNMLCAGWPDGKSDTCAGDSGGGLMCPLALRRRPTRSGRTSRRTAYSVQGITSFGDGCGLRNKYGIYTNVFNYIRWIYYVMDSYS